MLRYSELQQSQYLACNALEMNAHTILSNTCGKKNLWKSCGKDVEKMWKSTIFRGCKSRYLGVNRGI